MLGLGLVLTATGYLVLGPSRRALERLVAEGARQGWLLEGGERRTGIGSATLLGARLRNADDTVTAELERITVRQAPWLPARVTVTGVGAELRGDPVGWLGLVTAARAWLANAELAGPLTVRLRHRLLGTVELDGVAVQEHDRGLGLRAQRLRVAGRDLDDVAVRFERRNDSLVAHLGPAAGGPRAQLAFFPSANGTAHWILDLPHQPVRALAAVLGWPLAADHDAARVAGTVAFDIPDDAAAPVRGRVQLVFDAWPTHAPPAAAPLLGGTFSLSASLTPATIGPGWELPHVEVKQPVFTLRGEGTLDPGPRRWHISARGDRGCRELRALLPASEDRDRVARFVATTRDAASARAGLALRWDADGATWSLAPGCGLVGW